MGFKFKTIFHVNEKQNTVKHKGRLFFLVEKYIKCPNITPCLPKNIFSLEFGRGARALPAPRLLRLCISWITFFYFA